MHICRYIYTHVYINNSKSENESKCVHFGYVIPQGASWVKIIRADRPSLVVRQPTFIKESIPTKIGHPLTLLKYVHVM